MKPYGHKRRDNISCMYGCCRGKSNPYQNAIDFVNKVARKRARQEGKKEILKIIEKI